MKRSIGRRALLMTAGAAAVTSAAAQSPELRGSITLKDGATIPEGHIEIHLEDSAIADKAQRRIAQTRIDSDGKSKSLEFSLSAAPSTSPTLRIVARLKRPGGHLLARGSAKFDPASPIHVTLNKVMY